jgi:DNA topoisomerase I
LKKFYPKLTAKVFRTYNASKTLNELLGKDTEGLKEKSNTEKLDFYNNANREVAILCNHQRTVPKTFQQQLERFDIKKDEKQNEIDLLKECKKIMKVR